MYSCGKVPGRSNFVLKPSGGGKVAVGVGVSEGIGDGVGVGGMAVFVDGKAVADGDTVNVGRSTVSVNSAGEAVSAPLRTGTSGNLAHETNKLHINRTLKTRLCTRQVEKDGFR